MTNAVYHTFLPNGEFWVASRSVAKLREIGTIVLDPALSDTKFYEWKGEIWKTHPVENLPSEIKVILLICPVPEELKRRFKHNIALAPIYICNWK